MTLRAQKKMPQMAFFKPSEWQNKDVKGEIEKKKLR